MPTSVNTAHLPRETYLKVLALFTVQPFTTNERSFAEIVISKNTLAFNPLPAARGAQDRAHVESRTSNYSHRF